MEDSPPEKSDKTDNDSASDSEDETGVSARKIVSDDESEDEDSPPSSPAKSSPPRILAKYSPQENSSQPSLILTVSDHNSQTSDEDSS